jgi:glycine cleavage system aminomethyltransferase T
MKRSALFYIHQRDGAQFGERWGWEVPVMFSSPELEFEAVRESSGLTDLSYFAKLDLQAEPAQDSWRLGRNHYLILGEPPINVPAGATDITSVYADLFLAGPLSRSTLGKLTSLNVSASGLSDRACAQASVAHVHATVLREDIKAIPGFHILVSREYAEAVWEAIVHAGHEFHLQSVGFEALTRLQRLSDATI